MATIIDTMHKEMARRLARLREEMKWQQGDLVAELARLGVKVSESQIGHLESGRRRPSVEVLTALAAVYDTSTDYLLGLTDNELAAHDVEEELATGGIGGKFEGVMARLSRERQVQALEYAGYLALLDQIAGESTSNLRALQAAMSVLRRTTPPALLEDFIHELASEFPSIADTVSAFVWDRSPSSGEQKRVNRG